MRARVLFLLALLAALGLVGVWRLGVPDPAAPALDGSRAEPDAGPSAEARSPVAPGSRAEVVGERRAPAGGPGPLVIEPAPRPEPGTRVGPVAREHSPNGELLYEAHQAQRADGTWVLDGHWTAWHPNGELWEQGEYRDEKEHGSWQWWAENGQLVATGSFVDGAREGPWTYWYESGGTLMDAHYAGGEANGRWVLWHENGLKWGEGAFVRGEIAGRWTFWTPDGVLDVERSGVYEGGGKVAD